MITTDQLLASMRHETKVIKQLFLYAKESGNTALGPANCWVGVDPPKKTA